MTPSHFILGTNDDSWDKMTPLQDVMVANDSVLGSSMVAKVAIFATYNIAFKSWCLSWSGINFGVINTICQLYSFYHVPCFYTTKVIINARYSAIKGSSFDEKWEWWNRFKINAFQCIYVMIVNILSIVNTKQCLLSYRALLSWIYLSQHKDNPIKASYAVIFYSVLDIPLWSS